MATQPSRPAERQINTIPHKIECSIWGCECALRHWWAPLPAPTADDSDAPHDQPS